MYAGSALKAMLGEVTTGTLPSELIPVDRILQRYWVANGDGLPTEAWDDNPRYSRTPPLDDDTATVVDKVNLRLPSKTKKIIVAWYGTPAPTHVIAEDMGMSPRSLETAWRLGLNFLKLKFEMTNDATLLKLLRVRV